MSAQNEHAFVWLRYFGNALSGYDCDGRLISFSEYGKYTESGWHIDHVRPTAFGGLDVYANKRPRHWRGNTLAGAILGNALKRRGLF